MKSYKELNHTEDKSEYGEKVIYFQGELEYHNETPGGHLYIKCKDVKIFRMFNGVITYSNVDNPDDYHFMIPKRRVNVTVGFKKLSMEQNKYIFKLIQESRSKKMMVAEVFSA